jgi:hypothetical protein
LDFYPDADEHTDTHSNQFATNEHANGHKTVSS